MVGVMTEYSPRILPAQYPEHETGENDKKDQRCGWSVERSHAEQHRNLRRWWVIGLGDRLIIPP